MKRRAAGDIESVTIDGHAGYADPGFDIVCAAVSGISIGLLNAMEKLLEVEPAVEQGESGFLRCTFPDNLEEDVQEKLQLLAEAMIISLQSVAAEYGKYVRVLDKS